MDNLEKWERFADIDPKFTKAITGKPYKGTSPNPQYIIRCLTEMYGPAGHGFGWKVLVEGFEPLGEEVLHWCRIWFWTEDTQNGFESYGQTKALMKTRNGLLSDEDAPKKSMTDAIIKAASYMGIASNIFLGRWDDQKYVAEVNAKFRDDDGGKEKREPAPPPNAAAKAIKIAMTNAVEGAKDTAQLNAITGDPRFKADMEKLYGMDAEAGADVATVISRKSIALAGVMEPN